MLSQIKQNTYIGIDNILFSSCRLYFRDQFVNDIYGNNLCSENSIKPIHSLFSKCKLVIAKAGGIYFGGLNIL